MSIMINSLIKKAFCYVIPYDTGFAPNPFHGLCTLATCKPQIRLGVAQRILASYYTTERITEKITSAAQKKMPDSEFIRKQGIWVIGIASKDTCNKIEKGSIGRILYMMQVTEVMTYGEYWNAHPEKRPPMASMKSVAESSPKKEADYMNLGDNIYTEDLKILPLYSQHSNHDNESMQSISDLNNKDRRGVYVLLSDNFLYFGKDAIKDRLEIPLAITQGRTIYEKGFSRPHPRISMDDDTLLEKLEESLSNQFNLAKLDGRIGFPCHSWVQKNKKIKK